MIFEDYNSVDLMTDRMFLSGYHVSFFYPESEKLSCIGVMGMCGAKVWVFNHFGLKYGIDFEQVGLK